jgi:hypothetical protein
VTAATDLKAGGGCVVGFFSSRSLLSLLLALTGKSGEEGRVGEE